MIEDLKLKIKNYLEQLRALPDEKKKIILWTVVGILAVIMVFFWINGAVNKLSKINMSEMPNINLENIEK